MQRVVLFASKTGYQVREFASAAEAVGVDLVLATDRCHILDDPWGDRAVPVPFDYPEGALQALRSRGPFHGVLAVGDRPAVAAAQLAPDLGLRFHSFQAALDAGDKFRTRVLLREAGMPVPSFRAVALSADAVHEARNATFPAVLKPLFSSASRGVIRADNEQQFAQAFERIRKMVGREEAVLLVEDFIPGREFALEGIVTGGSLQVLALFDKPDPLDGPVFEESIYVTPSREPEAIQEKIRETARRAVAALGLSDGPVHAEMRVNQRGVWMLEAAARPIGGLCSRVLRFEGMTFEELLLRHSLGHDVSTSRLSRGAHGVMMIPIPRGGVYRGVTGVEAARAVPGVEDVVITAKEGQELIPLPEGSSYLGFLFSRGESADVVECALRQAHARLHFDIAGVLEVVT